MLIYIYNCFYSPIFSIPGHPWPQEAFGRLVLQGTFEATLAIAAVLSIQRQCRTKVPGDGIRSWVCLKNVAVL